MALTQTESAILDLHDAGTMPKAIAQKLGAKPSYVRTICERYTVSGCAENRDAKRVRSGSATLALRVIAAGGHRR